MSNPNDLVIENGVLKKYVGSDWKVTIPESVTSIGNRAFYGCSGLTIVTIPESVTSIGNWAFCGCRWLWNVTIPESVTSIGDWAFFGCSSLKSMTIPAGVTSIMDGTFRDCSDMTSVTISEGVTSIGNRAFCGCSSLTSVTIPAGVTSIGNQAFYGCSSLTSVTIPAGVTSIGDQAFYGCSSLTSVTIPEGLMSIGVGPFEGCSKLTSVTIPESVTIIGNSAPFGCSTLQQLLLNERQFKMIRSFVKEAAFAIRDGDSVRYLAWASKSDRDNLADYADAGNLPGYDLELINNGPVYKYRMPARLLGALGRLLDPVELTEENRALYVELLNKNAKKLVPIAEELRFPRILIDFFSLGILDAKTDKAVRRLLSASSMPEIAQLAETATLENAMKEKKSMPKQMGLPPAWKNPLKEKYADKLRAIKGDAAIKKMKLMGISMPRALLKDGSEAPEELFRFLLASYGSQLGGKYRFVPEADEAAALLRYDALCEAMDAVSGHLDGPNYPAVLPLLCRFGNVQQIQALTDAWKSWGKWERYNRRGRTAQETLEAAMVLSDTREAVIWLEKHGGLTQYAALRGVTVEEVYERHLFDFGFDETGKRVFELGTTTLEATLTPELTVELFDTEKKKIVRSVPKKNVDPSLQKKIADELADMRRNLKKAAGIKNGQLFKDYLKGTEITSEQWEQSYLGNPFLRTVARLLVWGQGDACFILTPEGTPIDSAGSAYTITDLPIRVAHPMEMDSAEVERWQKYFTSCGLKQPFQQIWEPIYRAEEIRPDRYKGCRINPLYLKNQQRRGIDADWYETAYYQSKHVLIEGFRVEAKDAETRPGDEREYVELVTVEPLAWNRRANMVIGYLDRITVWDRVKKDDVSVMRQMERFTLAQIMEMIGLAQEANAVNVLAALLEHKNGRFADYKPMDEFTLDW